MTFEDRIDRARARNYEAYTRFRQLSREISEAREGIRQQRFELAIGRMKQGILVGKIKKNRLIAECHLRTDVAHFGLPIQ